MWGRDCSRGDRKGSETSLRKPFIYVWFLTMKMCYVVNNKIKKKEKINMLIRLLNNHQKAERFCIEIFSIKWLLQHSISGTTLEIVVNTENKCSSQLPNDRLTASSGIAWKKRMVAGGSGDRQIWVYSALVTSWEVILRKQLLSVCQQINA